MSAIFDPDAPGAEVVLTTLLARARARGDWTAASPADEWMFQPSLSPFNAPEISIPFEGPREWTTVQLDEFDAWCTSQGAVFDESVGEVRVSLDEVRGDDPGGRYCAWQHMTAEDLTSVITPDAEGQRVLPCLLSEGKGIPLACDAGNLHFVMEANEPRVYVEADRDAADASLNSAYEWDEMVYAYGGKPKEHRPLFPVAVSETSNVRFVNDSSRGVVDTGSWLRPDAAKAFEWASSAQLYAVTNWDQHGTVPLDDRHLRLATTTVGEKTLMTWVGADDVPQTNPDLPSAWLNSEGRLESFGDYSNGHEAGMWHWTNEHGEISQRAYVGPEGVVGPAEFRHGQEWSVGADRGKTSLASEPAQSLETVSPPHPAAEPAGPRMGMN